jgi:hypothetical protein
VVNDLDFDVSENPAAAAAYKNDQRNIRKVKEATAKLQVNKGSKLCIKTAVSEPIGRSI